MKAKMRKILTVASICLLMAGGGAIINSQRAEALPGGGYAGGGVGGGGVIGVSCPICMYDQTCQSSTWGHAKDCTWTSYGLCVNWGSCY